MGARANGAQEEGGDVRGKFEGLKGLDQRDPGRTFPQETSTFKFIFSELTDTGPAAGLPQYQLFFLRKLTCSIFFDFLLGWTVGLGHRQLGSSLRIYKSAAAQ